MTVTTDTNSNVSSAINSKRLIIQGVTPTGDKFRPSNWAERMCGNLCSFRNRRMIYSPLLRPAVINGIKCVIIGPELETTHPTVFQQVIDFASQNNLSVIEDSE